MKIIQLFKLNFVQMLIYTHVTCVYTMYTLYVLTVKLTKYSKSTFMPTVHLILPRSFYRKANTKIRHVLWTPKILLHTHICLSAGFLLQHFFNSEKKLTALKATGVVNLHILNYKCSIEDTPVIILVFYEYCI